MASLKDLIALADEPDSARRRELLRGVTDLFFAEAPGLAEAKRDRYGEVMARLAHDMEVAVRAELSGRLAKDPLAPRQLVKDLAHDVAAVSTPVLAHSPLLAEPDLIELAKSYDQDRLRAISRRAVVPEAVSDAIVEHGDDATLGLLLANDGAALSRAASEAAVDRALDNEALHEAVVGRADLPADLLNEMYFAVEARLREDITRRNASLSPEALEAALAAGRARVQREQRASDAQHAAAVAYIRDQIRMGMMTPQALATLLRRSDPTKFLIALAELAEIDFDTARRIFDGKNVDSMAIACKAAGFDRALFLTVVIMMLGAQGNAMGHARTYGELYTALDAETAGRAIRFWRLRRDAQAKAA